MKLQMTQLTRAFLASLMIGMTVPSFAAVVTTPVGVYTNPGGTNMGDPVAADVWLRTNVRNGGSVGIASTYPRNVGGSAFMSLGANTGNNGKADWEYYPAAGFGRLADVGTLSYEWYRAGTSTVASHFHPALRLLIDADGNPATTNDRGYLVFERSYNPSVSAVPTDTWTAENITNSTNLWWSQFGVGINEVYNRTLAQYKAGPGTGGYTADAGFAQLGPNSTILGVSSGIGSGWASGVGDGPAFNGAVDNITLVSATTGSAQLNSANFELVAPAVFTPASVPTLSAATLVALIGLFVLGMGWVSRRRAVDN